ncbi:ABC transporter substrate-binding protein [Desulfosoma caldarium]|uniref:Amino acid/amide ABC transporter substrate-binding protein (HAAT family) n=1 Tax=Desulfosoma caldarium TaxID=610254 RepID=A0A3N1VFP7_9BACT|nr:ABC transporter substrate-binding protein [Desulfosoma caldarium]ROR01693.1 amino acid/amide ABC transporter substrate-binding protein (HAAT family) [Desulfosoma caldarium]
MRVVNKAQKRKRSLDTAGRKSLGLMLALVLTLWGCHKEPIRLGLAGVITGPWADLGIHARNGARLAVEEINRRGGVSGRVLELLVQNDEGTLEGAKRARELLVAQGASVIIGHMLSTQCLDALPELERIGVPLFSPVASSALLTGKKDLFFRLRPDSQAPANFLARHLITRGLDRVGILYDATNPGYTEPWVSALTQTLESLGGHVVLTKGFSRLEKGTEVSLAEAVLEKEPRAVVLVASAQETAQLLVAMRRAKIQSSFFGVGWAQTDRLITEAGRAAEFLILATNDPPLEEVPEAAEFVHAYRERFGMAPNFAAARSYDTVRFLVQALESVGGRPERLRKALAESREFHGLFGRLTMDAYGDVHGESYLVGVRDGRFVKLAPQ